MMLKKVILAATLVSGATLNANAIANDTDIYLFGSAGQSDFDVSTSDFDENYFSPSDAGIYTSSLDKTDTAYKLGIGFQISKNIGLEVQYIDLGELEYKADIFSGLANIKTTAKVKGAGLNLVGSLPFDKFSVFGKVGYQSLKTEIDQKLTWRLQGLSATRLLN